MKFTQLHSFLELFDRDTFGLCDIEFYALKVFFSATSDNMNIEIDDENDDACSRKKQGHNVCTAGDCDSSLFRVKYLPKSEAELALLRN